jgi:toxin ParE1/3/4
VAEVWIHAAAEAEYEAAPAWYLTRNPRAAAGFEAAIEHALEFVATFPAACPLCDEWHRHCAVRRYPYGLVYRVDGNLVRVVGVPHDRQLPRSWADRV